MIELKHLKTVLALAEQGSVNKAADHLYMTQSALSHQIKQLEGQLGLKLFERKTTPIQFTPAGQTLLKTAQDVLPKLQQTETILQALEQGEQGRLFIGVDCHTCFEWLLPMLRQYQQKWRGVDLDILNSLSDRPLKKLQQQQLDLVITSDPEPMKNLKFDPLFSYELVCVLPQTHSLTTKEWLDPQDFADETLIAYPVEHKKLDVFRRFLNPQGVQPKQLRHSELTLMMLQLVDSGRGLCVLPKWLIETQPEFSHLPTRSLGKEGLWSILYAATHIDLHDQPYIHDFIQQVADKMDV
ncbi:LysR family transcriptional regulator [Thiomicrorhabdus sp. ZW0627]|uniref:LysR family transcriptional regulator n=1 Tax=Thiomicrorhabdus sp. ZW0627 TaxID=3039774 RepID=UPI0024366170|nr:LysR family transcriptional regulator [Thiomicrorhabdus sp. ZW0627]MDG6774295.1 LysR family transcriptional regulator [Thiomicrorhabdus sp. ZW0627]